MNEPVSGPDLDFLRMAIAQADAATAAGDLPFGAVLVDHGSQVVAACGSTSVRSGDVTGHAEMNVLRSEAVRDLSLHDRGLCTLYASTEPCAMCAGAAFWAGVGRVVFGLGVVPLYEVFGDRELELRIGCREVLVSGRRPTEVVGPAMEEIAKRSFGSDRTFRAAT